MRERIHRHALLKQLVTEAPVESQATLLEALAEAGLEVHQSTLSRDLRELGIRKVRGRYRTTDPSPPTTAGPTADPPPAESPGLPLVHGFTACGPNLI
ncbi:MAG: hypothetical protein P8188_15990, partial [Gemmatimonadota bacterium]